MKPINNKSLLHFIFDQMEKLDRNEISIENAKAQANLGKQANNSFKYELDRVKTLIDVDQYNKAAGTTIELRNVEGKNFD
jgi:hypothetical protein